MQWVRRGVHLHGQTPPGQPRVDNPLTPPGQTSPVEITIEAAGTHPTGMHFFKIYFRHDFRERM